MPFLSQEGIFVLPFNPPLNDREQLDARPYQGIIAAKWTKGIRRYCVNPFEIGKIMNRNFNKLAVGLILERFINRSSEVPIEQNGTPNEQFATLKRKLHWFHPTPGLLLILLLAVEGILLLCDWFRWTPKGWAVLLVIAAVGVFLLVMLLWLGVSLTFRRRFQFSIRSLMLLTVAVAVPCSWLGVEMKWAEKQMKAVKALAKRDGESLLCVIGYEDFKYSTFPAITGGSPLGSSSSRLRKVFGDDFFDNATHVCFFGDRLTDAKLDHLEELPHIQRLSLYVDQLTDADLARLKGLTQLHELYLSMNQLITDAGLERLKGMTQLQELDLIATNVTAAGIAKLQKALPNCKIVH